MSTNRIRFESLDSPAAKSRQACRVPLQKLLPKLPAAGSNAIPIAPNQFPSHTTMGNDLTSVAQLETNILVQETPTAVQRNARARSGYRRNMRMIPAGRMYWRARAVVPMDPMAAMEDPLKGACVVRYTFPRSVSPTPPRANIRRRLTWIIPNVNE
jgi:hypothetical protein